MDPLMVLAYGAEQAPPLIWMECVMDLPALQTSLITLEQQDRHQDIVKT